MYEPIEVAIALSLYDHNVPSAARAKKLEMALPAEDVDVKTVAAVLHDDAISFATRLHPLVAAMYLRFALEEYGEEARKRVALWP